MASALTCPDCGYVWQPRKGMTRYPRQCPKCKHTHLDGKSQGNNTRVSPPAGTTAGQHISPGSRWPQVVYDLMGVSDAPSPESALTRAFELCRRLSRYRFKYDLKSLEEVLDFLEKTAEDGNRRGSEAEKHLREIMNDPALIFYETVGHDLTAPEYYEYRKKEGYEGDFMDFVSEIVTKYLEEHGLELKDRDDLLPPHYVSKKNVSPPQ